jgi:hypothetical protein
LSSDVGPVPVGVPGLTFVVTGGTFAAAQDTGCTRVDATHVSCTGLTATRPVGFRVDSTSTSPHDVRIALQVPSGYDDTNAADDGDTVTVAPGVDLHLALASPSTPRPDGRTYQVSTVLTGVRTGPVTLAVDGATVLASSCTRTTSDDVRCAAPVEGQHVTFTLRSNAPAASQAVSVTAKAAASLAETDAGDNSVALTLSPDVVLTSVTTRGDLTGGTLVRAQVTGVPAGTGSVRIRLSGSGVGTGSGQVHLMDGAAGADGQGPVDCYTSDADGTAVATGLWATCTGVGSDDDGSFYVDMRVAHPGTRSSTVTFTVVPVKVDEGPFTDDNSRDLTLG